MLTLVSDRSRRTIRPVRTICSSTSSSTFWECPSNCRPCSSRRKDSGIDVGREEAIDDERLGADAGRTIESTSGGSSPQRRDTSENAGMSVRVEIEAGSRRSSQP